MTSDNLKDITFVSLALLYILVNETAASQILHMDIGTDNKMHAAVRDYSGNWQTILNSVETINPGIPYFAVMKWQLSSGNLNVWMYLNDSIYASAPISNFKDFTGAMTAVGSYNDGTYQLNGDMEKFCYTKDVLTDSQIAAIRASASSSVTISYDTLGRLAEKTVNTAKTTSYSYEDGIGEHATTTRVSTIT